LFELFEPTQILVGECMGDMLVEKFAMGAGIHEVSMDLGRNVEVVVEPIVGITSVDIFPELDFQDLSVRVVADGLDV